MACVSFTTAVKTCSSGSCDPLLAGKSSLLGRVKGKLIENCCFDSDHGFCQCQVTRNLLVLLTCWTQGLQTNNLTTGQVWPSVVRFYCHFVGFQLGWMQPSSDVQNGCLVMVTALPGSHLGISFFLPFFGLARSTCPEKSLWLNRAPPTLRCCWCLSSFANFFSLLLFGLQIYLIWMKMRMTAPSQQGRTLDCYHYRVILGACDLNKFWLIF